MLHVIKKALAETNGTDLPFDAMLLKFPPGHIPGNSRRTAIIQNVFDVDPILGYMLRCYWESPRSDDHPTPLHLDFAACITALRGGGSQRTYLGERSNYRLWQL